MALNGNDDEANGYNSVIKNGVAPDADLVKAIMPPIGSVVSWLKTFGTADSGTTDGTTASKLVQSGQNFITTVDIGMIVYNTTDSTYANVTAIDSDTTLSLDSDIMATAEAYTIYKTPKLPDGWVECDGTSLSDSDSPYDGETLPDLNGDERFLRGAATSAVTGGATTSNHRHTLPYNTSNSYVLGTTGFVPRQTVEGNVSNNTGFYAPSIIPPYYSVVWIMRIK